MKYYSDITSLVAAMNEKLERNAENAGKKVEKKLARNAKKYETTIVAYGEDGGISDPRLISSSYTSGKKSINVTVKDFAKGSSPMVLAPWMGEWQMYRCEDSYDEYPWDAMGGTIFSYMLDQGRALDLPSLWGAGIKVNQPAKPFITDTQKQVDDQIKSESGDIYNELTRGLD